MSEYKSSREIQRTLQNARTSKSLTVLPVSISLKDIGTKYKIDVMAIDIYGKTKMAGSTLDVTTPNMIVETLQYPIMTTKGMVNTKADELDKIYQSHKKVYL